MSIYFPLFLSEGICQSLQRYLDRNTTLAHPDADTSTNATLEARDVTSPQYPPAIVKDSTSRSLLYVDTRSRIE
ncbi:hypothetical protein OIDMADRAFT_21137 [Oidiodendron maius Zn]|uniref:Uncharacterized protein n=1 Tax=Oidiodendron maius (strain Zn) TaxID=913774 RepID=A0A0C3C904_OIDMZ|nr:hypothetical protein OIDMADRAFT_21137 [Oidiodendron maius Zn]